MSRDTGADDGVYSDQTTGGPYSDTFEEEEDEGRRNPAVPYTSAFTPGWWPLRSRRSEERPKPEYSDDGDPRREDRSTTRDAGGWDAGLSLLLILTGVILFLIPEPVTSTIGAILVLAGVLAWVADALR